MDHLLQFTLAQQAAIWAARNKFNAGMVALAANAAFVADLEGNAITVPMDAWKRIDTRVQQIARNRLAVFGRLAAANTTPVSIADLVNYYPQVSDSGEVLVTMDGRNNAKADQAAAKYVGTPVPILTATTRFGWRQMAVMSKGGSTLDTTSIANDQRKIAEKLEDMALNGLSSINVGGDTIYGLRNLPGRNTVVHGLTLATATGAQWLGLFRQIIAAAMGDNQYGRITIFVNIGDFTSAELTDYAAGYSGTILERLRSISQIVEIVPASSIPVNEVIGVVDLAEGTWGSILSAMPIATRPKTRIEPEDDYVFGTMAAAAPQFRTDYLGQSPFVHATQA